MSIYVDIFEFDFHLLIIYNVFASERVYVFYLENPSFYSNKSVSFLKHLVPPACKQTFHTDVRIFGACARKQHSTAKIPLFPGNSSRVGLIANRMKRKDKKS